MVGTSFLRNRYWVLRHGKSFPNERGLIVSSMYAEIWDIDEKDPFARPEGGESVKDVACRLARVVAVMESEFTGFLHLSIWN